MAKIHKALRLDGGLVDRVNALKKPDETDISAYTRVLLAGCSALECADRGENTSRTRDEQGEHGEEHAENTPMNTPPYGQTVEEMRDHIETLKQATEYMREQLKVKDEQIAEANRLADQAQVLTGRAQELHAMSTDTKALESGERPTWRERWHNFWN